MTISRREKAQKNSAVYRMLTKLQTEVTAHKTTLGVESSNAMGSLLINQSVDARTIRDAATDFYVRAINLNAKGLTSTPANISKYAEPVAKTVAIDASPTL
jgi:hypothetical protein